MNSKLIIRILIVLIIVAVIASAAAYAVFAESKPNFALYCAMGGGMVILNFIMAIILVKRNSKN